MDCRGYSLRIVDANNKASPDNLGVKLGRLCISKGISAAEVAEILGVTRVAVYNWFTGKFVPRAAHERKIEEFIKTRRLK